MKIAKSLNQYTIQRSLTPKKTAKNELFSRFQLTKNTKN